MCARCQELEEEVAWLKGELGLRLDADKIAVLSNAFGFSPNQTKMALTLLASNGRPVTRIQLDEAMPGAPERSYSYVSVYVSHIRQALGFDAIETVWGQGYRLTPAGAEKIRAALAPTQKVAA
jgi:DNA-binding response OmpR family regulator